MTRTRLTVRQHRRVPLGVAFLCLLALGLAPQASVAGSGAFTPTGSMLTARFGPAAAPLPDGRALVVGGRRGFGASSVVERSAEVFDPATNSFFTSVGIGSMSVPRSFAAAAPLPDGRVLVVGGYDGSSPLSSAEVFDPTTNSFSAAGIGSMSVPRYTAAAAPLPDGRVLVAGGNNGSGNSLSSAEVFDPATNSFSSAGIGFMTLPRSSAAAAPLPDGRVLVAGGQHIAAHPPVGLNHSSAEVFNPATGTFSRAGIGSMSVPRSGAAAAPLPDGVLVAGGEGGGGSSAEGFDPTTNSFSAAGIGSMSVARIGAAAAPLPGGRVLVAGGCCSASGLPDLSSAEIFALASCRGKQATIVGTDGADQITGTPGADVIIGVGGNDRLFGLAGKDVICGGKGNDTLKGGAGNDQLSGQKGNDKLFGQKGNDKLSGKGGKDTLKGGPGKDILKGGAGKDKQVQ